MTDEGSTGGQDQATAGESAEPSKHSVPPGNLFATPKLTALDPAEKGERREAERLLEALDEEP